MYASLIAKGKTVCLQIKHGAQELLLTLLQEKWETKPTSFFNVIMVQILSLLHQ